MNYILLLDNNNHWKIDSIAFHAFLNENWQQFYFNKITDSSRPYSHEWRIDAIGVEGFLHKNGDSIHIDGDFLSCINFVLLIRKFIPQSEKLLFFDGSYNYNTIIESTTTKENLIDIFS